MDFEKRIRDQTTSRSPTSTAQHETEGDLFYAEVRFGADFRYQKNLTFQLLFENQSVFDGNLVDDRSNTSNPGGTGRVWPRRCDGKPGLSGGALLDALPVPGHAREPVRRGRSWTARVRPGSWAMTTRAFSSRREFGDLTLWAKALVSRESSALGLQNDNDQIITCLAAAYDLKPHRFGADVVYFRDRFTGADTQAVGCDRADMGCTGQKIDSVWINASWTGRFGPVRSLLQGNIILGTADGAHRRHCRPGSRRGKSMTSLRAASLPMSKWI